MRLEHFQGFCGCRRRPAGVGSAIHGRGRLLGGMIPCS